MNESDDRNATISDKTSPDDCLTIEEVAKRLRISRQMVGVCIKSGDLAVVEFGARKVVLRHDFEDFVARHRRSARSCV